MSDTERELGEIKEAIVRKDGLDAVTDVRTSISTLSNSLEELADGDEEGKKALESLNQNFADLDLTLHRAARALQPGGEQTDD